MKTVRVRIPVAVNSIGEWCGHGVHISDDKQNAATAQKWWGDSSVVVAFLEAELPIPPPPEPVAELPTITMIAQPAPAEETK